MVAIILEEGGGGWTEWLLAISDGGGSIAVYQVAFILLEVAP